MGWCRGLTRCLGAVFPPVVVSCALWPSLVIDQLHSVKIPLYCPGTHILAFFRAEPANIKDRAGNPSPRRDKTEIIILEQYRLAGLVFYYRHREDGEL